MMGFGAGATGLAIKFVVLQFVGVNVQFWFNARFLSLRFWRYAGHQVLCVSCLISAAIMVKFIIDGIPAFQDEVILSFLVSGLVYSLGVVGLGFCLPIVFGLRNG